jgi:bifunctional DNA-binding transcriptional regulator/antitoxin component of YhaV-PrlF toxin-antitoxin module
MPKYETKVKNRQRNWMLNIPAKIRNELDLKHDSAVKITITKAAKND